MTKPVTVASSWPCRGLLFDLDGTLIDSIHAVDRAWIRFSERHGLNPEEVLPKIHGRRSIDSIRALLPDVDAEAEDAFIRHWEATDTEGVRALPGALELLQSLPADSWGIVTSGTIDVATARAKAAGIAIPPVFVVGGDVQRGKPAPDPFLEGARRLGRDPAQCIGFEDAPAGIQSVQSAGMRAIAVGLAGHHPRIDDYLRVRFEQEGDDLILWID